jgi:hypothetical protein
MDIIVFLLVFFIVIVLSIIIYMREIRRGARWTKAITKIIKNIFDVLSGGV